MRASPGVEGEHLRRGGWVHRGSSSRAMAGDMGTAPRCCARRLCCMVTPWCVLPPAHLPELSVLWGEVLPG